MATSYNFDLQTVTRIQSLKHHFGTTTNTGVIRRAIALIALIVKHVDLSQGTLVVGGKDGVLTKIVIA